MKHYLKEMNSLDKLITLEDIYEELPVYPKFVKGIRRAPKREMLLNEKDIKLALKNALRYIPLKWHEIIAGEFYEELISKYPIILIEDGLNETDYEGFKYMTSKLGNQIQIVGDDLYVTNQKRLEKGIKLKASNSILIKPNQIGTVSETIDCIKLAQLNNFSYIISERSGETMDDFISDLAVGTSAPFIKMGSMSKGERMAKYSRLLQIEKELLYSKLKILNILIYE